MESEAEPFVMACCFLPMDRRGDLNHWEKDSGRRFLSPLKTMRHEKR